jgi:predicted DNA binding CopG/RHH family protein
MRNSATSLQAKILAINTGNEHSEKIINYELSQLSKFIGQNILKVDGSFKAKINHTLHENIKKQISAYGFEWWIHTNYYFSANYSKLTINVKTCISGGGCDKNEVSTHCIYHDNSIDLFKIDGLGNLQPLEKQYFENRQFDETQILEAQTKIKEAAKEYEKILSSMPYEFRSVTGCERLTR